MDRFIDFFRYKTIEEWAAIATIGSFVVAIVALMIALFTWVFPDPLARTDPGEPAPNIQAHAEKPSESSSPAAKPVEAEAPLYEIVKSEQYWFPWTRWITQFFSGLPGETWPFLLATFCFAGIGLSVGAVLLMKNWDESLFPIILMLGIFALSIWLSVKRWGGWGILWGILIAYGVVFAMMAKRIFGALIGAFIGGLFVTSIMLGYFAVPGPIIEVHLFVASLVGMLIGAGVGAWLIKDSLFES